jgi:2-dehydro-3-deoxygluconokinase
MVGVTYVAFKNYQINLYYEEHIMAIQLKPAAECRFDELSLGEVMIRFDPGHSRIHTSRQFTAWEGGGEYNVARGLRRCFGLRTALVTSIVDNQVGRLLEDLILQGGVDMSHVKWVPFDGLGRAARNGLNFTEAGYGVRGAVGCGDRGNTAVSQLKKGDIDWERIFGEEGVRWFHCGGIFAALSATTPDVAIEALQTAQKYGTVTSYDLNYRPSLWKEFGGQAKAQEVNREVAKYVDVMIGNEEDFTACLGYEIEGVDENLSELDPSAFKQMIEKVVADYPNFQAVATTLREVDTASVNAWSAVVYHQGEFHQAQNRNLWIYDRVGGGDSFASGLIYGFMEKGDALAAVEYGAAHGALAMTTPGDTSMASLKEVEKLVGGGSARVDR